MLGNPQTPGATRNKHEPDGERSEHLAQAVADGWRHGESDRILRSGFFAAKS
jgi:hypothetical protein